MSVFMPIQLLISSFQLPYGYYAVDPLPTFVVLWVLWFICLLVLKSLTKMASPTRLILTITTLVNLSVVCIIQTNMSTKHNNADQVNEETGQTETLKGTRRSWRHHNHHDSDSPNSSLVLYQTQDDYHRLTELSRSPSGTWNMWQTFL